MFDEREDVSPPTLLAVRGALGGLLMGLANLVPGISGGTMLLAAGVYPRFISAIAELTTLRFRVRSILLLGAVVGSAALAILLLAGAMRDLVVHQRWIMYSLFIGLTLGGAPLVWRLAKPLSGGVAAGAVFGFGVMGLMALGTSGGASGGGMLLTFFSGLAASSAMILPGISGGYLLLLLGQYESILETVDALEKGLSGMDPAAVVATFPVVIPLGLGVVAGVVGVSNLLRWLLERYAHPTLGALLGLLLGAVVGLWPFQRPEAPRPGDVFEGRVLTESTIAELDPTHWPLHSYRPTAGQAGASVGLIALGLVATSLVGRLGGSGDDENDTAA